MFEKVHEGLLNYFGTIFHKNKNNKIYLFSNHGNNKKIT